MSEKEPQEKEIPQRYAELTDEEKETLMNIIHDRMFWQRATKKFKFLSSIILGISGLVAAITYLVQYVVGGSK